MYGSARDLPPPPLLCGLRLTGFIFMELLSDIHTAHMGPREEGVEKKQKQGEEGKEKMERNYVRISLSTFQPVSPEVQKGLPILKSPPVWYRI